MHTNNFNEQAVSLLFINNNYKEWIYFIGSRVFEGIFVINKKQESSFGSSTPRTMYSRS